MKFGQESITKESQFSTKFIDTSTSSWIKTEIVVSKLIDESGLLNFDGGTEQTIYGNESDFMLNPSVYNKNPTEEEPDNAYIFTSLYFGQGKDLRAINRKTYNLLDWLGDWGGLLDGLKMIAKIFVSPLTTLALRANLFEMFARVKSPQENSSQTQQ